LLQVTFFHNFVRDPWFLVKRVCPITGLFIWALSNNRSISIQFLCTPHRGLYSCSGQLAFITGTFICSTVVNFTEVKVWVWANVVLRVWWFFCVLPIENGSGVPSRFIYFLPCVEVVRSWNWRFTFWNCASQLTFNSVRVWTYMLLCIMFCIRFTSVILSSFGEKCNDPYKNLPCLLTSS